MEYIKNDDGTFTCPECGVIKKHQSTMYYHMKQTHTNESKYKCDECDKGFMQKSLLNNHIAVHHPDKSDCPTFNCPDKHCDHSSKTKGNLRIHILRIHFADEIDAIYKKRTSVETMQHKCRGCKESFKSKTAFYYHAMGCIDLSDAPRRFRKILEIE
jgi:hypothetical protein